jgi:hypothetical protein
VFDNQTVEMIDRGWLRQILTTTRTTRSWRL